MSSRRPILIVFALVFAARAYGADFDLAKATNQLGIDLYRQIAAGGPHGNLGLSPYSIESGLALAYAGADGGTRREMARVLYFPADDRILQIAFASLRTSLDRTSSDSFPRAADQGKDVIEWHAANRLFGQQGYHFRSSFLELLRSGYEAPLESLDFEHQAEPARARINSWVEAETRKRIHDLIPVGGVNTGTKLVLVNALYLKAPWEKRFPEQLTTRRPFYSTGAEAEMIATMETGADLGYLKGDGFTAIAVPFLGDDLQLLVLVPDKRNGLGPLTAKLTPKLLHTCANLGARRPIHLFLPKFHLQGRTIGLAQSLEALGMKSAFNHPPGSADFGRAAPPSPDGYLALAEVFHQTFIAVDEEGTEAAAATATVAVTGTRIAENPLKPIEVHVDHPFFFAVQDCKTGTCLFFGSVLDPR